MSFASPHYRLVHLFAQSGGVREPSIMDYHHTRQAFEILENPTRAMTNAAVEELVREHPEIENPVAVAHTVWSAMLAAAQHEGIRT